MRVILLPYNIAGTASSLAFALRKRGHSAEAWVYALDWLNIGADRVLVRSHHKSSFFLQLAIQMRKWRMLSYLWKADVVVYCFGATVFYPARGSFPKWAYPFWVAYNLVNMGIQLIELAVAKARKIRIVVLFQGNDARRRDYAIKNFEINFAREADGIYSSAGDFVKRCQSWLFDHLADEILFMNPDLGHVLPPRSKFMPYPSVAAGDFNFAGVTQTRGPLVIGHAPTSRKIKGTELVIAAVQNLRASGIDVELKLFENIRRDEALKLYAHVDVFVDQLFAGWYGAVAVELMAMGKPVIAYVREDDLVHVDPSFAKDLPILSCKPDELEQTILRLTQTSRAELNQMGRNARNFVEKWHNPVLISEHIIR